MPVNAVICNKSLRLYLIVDWIQEGREDALYPEEDEHGNEQQYLTGNVDFVARSVTEEAVVRTDHGSQ